MGRMTIGDLNRDGQPDYDRGRHNFWHWSSYGYAGVPSRWGDADYMMLKKSWCQLYNPR